MQKRGKYSAGFKREAVELARTAGVLTSRVAGELGINANMLGRAMKPKPTAKALQSQGKATDANLDDQTG